MHVRQVPIAALLVAIVASGCGGTPDTGAAAAAMGRVRLASNQVTYRDLGEALLFAAAADTLELAPGLFRGALDVKGKHLRVVGDPEGRSELLVSSGGLRVTDGGGLSLENVTVRTEGAVGLEPVIDARDADLALRNVRALDLSRPLARFDSPGRVMHVAHSLISGGRAPSLLVVRGDLYSLACVFADNVGPVFSRGAAAGRLHAGHATLVGNRRLVDDGESSTPVNLAASIVENPGLPVDADVNLVLASGEAAALFPRKDRGDFSPSRMTRQDADGLDYGAVPSSDGAERLATAIPRWLELYNDYAAIRASGFVSDGGDGRALRDAIRDTFYRRVAAFLTGARRGLLVRDVLLALPFAPPDWHLRDRLDGALKGLAKGVPGRVLVAGDTQAVPGLAERLEAFFAKAYPARDPNEERRFVVEVTRPLGEITAKEALSREHEYPSPEHAKLARSLAMAENRAAQLTRKATDLKGRLAGLAQVRAVSRQAEPGLEERRGTEQLAELQRELVEVTAQQTTLKAEAGRLTATVRCHFEGERRVVRESLAVTINNELRLEPVRLRVEIDVAPEPACRFAGFQGRWERPSGDDWLADGLARDLLARTWLGPRLEALQAGLLKPNLARTESDESDAFFTLLFQDLQLLLGRALPPEPPTVAPNPEWLAISAGADGYPVVTVPYVPADANPEHEAWRLLPLVGRSVGKYAEERFGEPLFLFADAIR